MILATFARLAMAVSLAQLSRMSRVSSENSGSTMRNQRRIMYGTLAIMLAVASPTLAEPSPTFEKPRLVLQITVDQLRGDLPTRYFDRLGKGGLRFN